MVMTLDMLHKMKDSIRKTMSVEGTSSDVVLFGITVISMIESHILALEAITNLLEKNTYLFKVIEQFLIDGKKPDRQEVIDNGLMVHQKEQNNG